MEIITTIGPQTINSEKLQLLRKAGATDMRINLSHSNLILLKEYCHIFSQAGVSPSLDTQGAQLRLIQSSDKIMHKGEEVVIFFGQIDSEYCRDFEHYMRLNHSTCIDQIEVGDLIRIDFSGLALYVESINRSDDYIVATVFSEGVCMVNRAVDIVGKSIDIEHITEFDEYALSLVPHLNSKYLYYSFAKSASNVQFVRGLLPKNVQIVSKIESKAGVENLESIIEASDAILIDRGDLSRDFSISTIPMLVDVIIQACTKQNCPVFVATNILDTMMTSDLPSRSEISDIWNLLGKNISGIVLAAEVAIGKNPVDSVSTIKYMTTIRTLFENNQFHGYDLSWVPKGETMSDKLKMWI